MLGFKILNIKHLFPQELNLEVKQLLSGFSQKDIIMASSTFLSFLNKKSKFQDIEEFTKYFFCSDNNELANFVFEKWSSLAKVSKEPVIFFNPTSSLQLLQASFHLENKVVTLSNKEFELRLFKAYLILNYQNYLKIETGKQKLFESKYNRGSAEYTLALSFPYNDLINYDIHDVVISQFIKAYYLFNFLNADSKYETLIKLLVNYFQFHDSNEILNELMKTAIEVTNPKILNEKFIQFTFAKTKQHDALLQYIERLSLQTYINDDDFDFIEIREAPFYKIEDRTYRALYNLFIAEKMYKSLYFLFHKINNDNNLGHDIKYIYSKVFAEEFLVDMICRHIFQRNTVNLSDKDINQESAPDFYSRNNGTVYLIESKDVLLNKKIKPSYDIEIYEKEFRKKFYEAEDNGKIHGIGVKQLIRTIKNILTKKINYDSVEQIQDIEIYPILILHDRQFECQGFNHIINKWFMVEKLKLHAEGIDVSNVRPVTVINIDTLIIYMDYLTENMDLKEQINGYFKFNTNQCKFFLNHISHLNIKLKYPIDPFSTYLKSEIIKRYPLCNPKVFEKTTREFLNTYRSR